MTNISGSEAINKSVDSLIKKNQSSNETNLVKSLNITTTTDTSSHTTTDEKIFGEVIEQSSKKKTFGVYKTKQVIEDITPDVNAPVSDIVEKIPSNEITSLTNKTGIIITNDQGYAKAIKEANKLTADNASKTYSSMANTSISPSAIYISTEDGMLTKVESGINKTVATTKSPAIKGIYPSSPTLTYASKNVTFPDDDITEVKTKVPINFTDDVVQRSYVPDTMTADEFETARGLVNGSLKNEINCPDMLSAFGFDMNLSMLGDTKDSLMNMMDLGIDASFLDCFTNIYGQLNVNDKMNMLGKLTGNGDIAAMDMVLNQVSPNMLQSPSRDLLSLGNKYKATKNNVGKKTDLTSVENAALLNSVLNKAGVSKGDLLSTKTSVASKNKSIGDTITIMDITSIKSANGNNGILEYILGQDNAKLLTSLPV